MAAREALKILPGMSVRMSVGVNGDGLHSASHALLAENLLALHAHAGQERPRMAPKNWVGLAIAGEVPNENRSLNAGEQTTVTIRAAIAAS
jgi:hypothetical protein